MGESTKCSTISATKAPSDVECSLEHLLSDIPDFTPEQWAEIMERSRLLEDGYVPTRSLFPGL